MNKIGILLQEKDKWYPQGGSEVPIYITSSAFSGFEMEKTTGLRYSKFLFNFKEGWGEMIYILSDFDRLWHEIGNKTKNDKNYLGRMKEEYNRIFNSYSKFFQEINRADLQKASDEKLLEFLKRGQRAQRDAVGIGHLVEPIGIKIEDDLKAILTKEMGNLQDFNKIFALLTTPTKMSFIAEEEKELAEIGKLPESKQKEQIKKHSEKYSWIQNNYGGAQKVSFDYFKRRLKKGINGFKIEKIVSQKKKLINQLRLSEKAQELIILADFTTTWQDQRKANVLKSIGNLDKILDAISKRLRIKKELLYYLPVTQIQRFENLTQIKEMEKVLEERSQGVFFMIDSQDKELAVASNEYQKLIEGINKQKKIEINTELRGSIANPGTAIGKAAICLNLKDIGKVRKGDILVASMTRPEYMPAIKKAAAIVTDEGGITCHAAIISRELNIPCVVGTKIATKIFKDGDILEVRANHGVVRKIK